jgi:hypothetical protein
MSEVTELIKFLYGAGLSVVPWVVLGLLVWLVVTLKPHIASYIDAKSKARTDQIKKEGERNEIIRNCSATIEACTTALELVSNDRHLVDERLDKDEDAFKERLVNIQNVVTQCRDELVKTRSEISVLDKKIDHIS